MPQPQYLYDPTGTIPANRIVGERKTVTVSNGVNGFLIKPNAAPFFGDSMSIVDSDGNPLYENVHYYLSHPWKIGSDRVGKDLYGSISLIEGYPVDTYTLIYRTIGAEYVNNSEEVIEDALIASATDYLTVDWSTAPTYFPAAPHGHELDPTFQMIEFYHALWAIAAAIRSNDGQIHIDDVIDSNIFWINGTLNPSLELVKTTAENNNAVAGLLTMLLNNQKPFTKNSNIAAGMKNITVNLGGGFMLKTGRVIIPNTQDSGTIKFPKPYFTDQCLFLSGTISRSTGNGICRDKVYFGTPTSNDVIYEIDYQTPLVAGTRSINYITLGR